MTHIILRAFVRAPNQNPSPEPKTKVLQWCHQKLFAHDLNASDTLQFAGFVSYGCCSSSVLQY
jgi:hypothetical protein